MRMNEISLSSNLRTITAEINSYKQMAGQSIFEIGRRLKHIKENDLVHGEWEKYCNSTIEITPAYANRYIKVFEEFKSSNQYTGIGLNKLYHIATLPEEDRKREHVTSKGEVKTVDEMTVRELEELKRENQKQKKIIKDLENKEPEIIEKEVIKKELPFDYSDLKSDNQQLEFSNRRERDRNKELTEQLTSADEENEYLKKQLDDLLNERAEVDEKSRKYDELTEGIHELEGKMNAEQKRLASYTNVIETVRKGNQFLDEVAGLVYATDIEEIQANDLVVRELNKLIERTYLFADDLSKKIKGTVILEEEHYQ